MSRPLIPRISNLLQKGQRLDRRGFLGLLTALGAGGLLAPILGQADSGRDNAVAEDNVTGPDATVSPDTVSASASAARFPQGIMAGDPKPDGTILWTRVALENSCCDSPDSGTPSGDIDVLWEVAEDATFDVIVAGGIVTAAADADHTLKIAVTGLDPDRWYAYRFTVQGVSSVTGRLRTAPLPGALPDRLRFVFASCQQINKSHYVAHRAIAQEGADFFMHLGDYIYVSDFGTITLDDYRNVYKRFRNNPDLQVVHAAVPTVAMWDDGEFSNYVNRHWDAQRLLNGARAWHEYMPVATDPQDPLRVYRQLAWGTLADILMIDVRTHSDGDIAETNSLTTAGAKMMDPSRSLLGREQLQWLKQGMQDSTALWRMVGQGFMIMPWRLVDLDTPAIRKLSPKWQRNAGIYAPTGDWDDYQADRRELLTHLQDRNIQNNIFCSGDLHLFFAGKLQSNYDDALSLTVGFDFCSGSLTADPDPRTLLKGFSPQIAEQLIHVAERHTLAVNRYMNYCNLLDQGYVVVDVTADAVEVTFRMTDSFDPNAVARTGARFRVPLNSTELQRLSSR